MSGIRFKKDLGRFNMFLFKTDLFITRGKIKQQYKNSKLKIVAQTWSDVFELTDGSYSVSNSQDLLDTS